MDDLKAQEQYVWCNTWWNNANNIELSRVLLIGDSIVCGYRPYVTNRLQGRANVDMVATSKGVCDENFEREMRCFINQYQYKAVHFNNGLHRVDMADDRYKKGLVAFVTLLRQEMPDAQLIWASSTPVTMVGNAGKPDIIKNAQVIRRNSIAAGIMQELNIEMNDLYTVAASKPEIKSDDGYHYNEDGQRALGEEVYQAIQKYI